MKLLTGPMNEILMDCHERELLQQEPVSYPTQSAKGLYTGGMVVPFLYKSPSTGKRFLAFCITLAGKNYLAKYCLKQETGND